MATSAIDLDLRHMPVLPERRDYPDRHHRRRLHRRATCRSRPTRRRATTSSRSRRARRRTPARWPSGTASRRSTTRGSSCSTTRAIQVLDIAFPPDQQLEIVQEAASAPHIKGILAQKPLAVNYAAGRAARARRRGRRQGRSPSTRTCATTSRCGRSRRCSTAATSASRCSARSTCGPSRTGGVPRGHRPADAAIMSIHHLDTFRYLFGDPEGIFASARPDPRTKFPHGDGICLYILEYDERLPRLRLGRRVDGPGARGVRGRHLHPVAGRGHRGPRPGHDRLAGLPDADAQHLASRPRKQPGCCSTRAGPRCGSPTPSRARWARCSTPSTAARTCSTGDDNLRTMALIEAGYRSLDEKRVVRIDEIHA